MPKASHCLHLLPAVAGVSMRTLPQPYTQQAAKHGVLRPYHHSQHELFSVICAIVSYLWDQTRQATICSSLCFSAHDPVTGSPSMDYFW